VKFIIDCACFFALEKDVIFITTEYNSSLFK
jgi:hypothetical protein